jgi:hypothetical protein
MSTGSAADGIVEVTQENPLGRKHRTRGAKMMLLQEPLQRLWIRSAR